MGELTAPKPKQRQVAEQYKKLESNMETTRGLLSTLRSRLGCVLTPAAPEGSEAAGPPITEIAPFADQLRTLRREVVSINNELDSILDRLEL